MYHIKFPLFLIAICTVFQQANAESLVDKASPLETLESEFGLADGPAWDGSAALYVPDVKGQRLYRYLPKQSKLLPIIKQAGRISATYYNHGQLYLADNGLGAVSVLAGNEKQVLLQFDQQAKPPIKPNDLVVDKHGGVYVTLTRQHQVMYITPEGKHSVAVTDIKTPNGIALSPSGSKLYVSAYVPKQVWSYTVLGPGKTDNGKVLAAMDSGPENGADGMTVDRAGNVYCTGPKHVWVWSPRGELLEKILVPTRPINCVFGDSDMRSLYITGFGGLYRQRMLAYGVVPHPSAKHAANANSSRLSTAIPASVTAHLDVVYGVARDRELLTDIFVPNEPAANLPAVVVVHGGGWLNGDKTKFRALAVELAKRGYVTAAIGYRLGHETRFPAGIQDCNCAVRFLRTHASQFRIDPQRIGAVGGSAGGHLVGLMATAPHVSELQGNSGFADESSRIQAAIVMAGPMQMATGSVAERSRKQPAASNSNVWLGKTIDEDPALYRLAAPFQHVSSKTPPMLFMVGEFDKPERNAAFRQKLQNLQIWTAVKTYENGKHGCWNREPWFAQMVQDMEAFFQQHL